MKCKFILLVVIAYFCIAYPSISYELSCGRMGDNLVAYLHAKWISYRYGQELLYRPFKNSDKFMLHNLEIPLDEHAYRSRAAMITKDNYRTVNLSDTGLYTIPYFSDFDHEYPGRYFASDSPLAIDWNDEGFRKIVSEYIAPIEPLKNMIFPPEPCISVAMHVRRGGLFDPVPTLKSDQLKFPPNSFFSEQLKFVCKKYPNKFIYAFIFTDDLNPHIIADEISRAMVGYNVVIDYRPTNTSDTAFVLEDFFSIPLFDVLIRPCSNFSYVAGKLGDFLLEISPAKYCVIGDEVQITRVEVVGKGV